MSNQANSDQNEFQRKLEDGEARNDRVIQSAVDSVEYGEFGSDHFTEPMQNDKEMWGIFNKAVIETLKNPNGDHRHRHIIVGRFILSEAARYVLKVSDDTTD